MNDREQFEAWHRSHFGWMECQYLPSGEYANGTIQQRYEVWQAARATPAQPVGDLHSAIMNLPCKMGRAVEAHGATKQAYKEGHRDARHAAAELVAAHEASQPSPSSVGDAIRAMRCKNPYVEDNCNLYGAGYAAACQEAAALAEQVQGQQVEHPPCKGENCGTTHSNHSPECQATHEAACAGGYFVKQDVLMEIIGCFQAAEIEGLRDALAETPDERLKDLVERRLMFAYEAALNAAQDGQKSEADRA